MNTSLPTSDEATQALAKVDPEIKTIIQAANELKVENDEQSQHAAKFLGDLKGELKRLEDMRKQLTTGLNDTLKKINNSFKLRSDPLKQADVIVKRKLGAYMDEQRRIQEVEAEKARAEQEEAEKKAREEAEKAAAEAAKIKDETERKKAEEEAAKKAEEAEQIKNQEPEVEAATTSVRTDAGLVSSKQVWTFEVEDKSKVPEEFKIVDEKAVRKAVNGGERNIPGIKIFQKTEIATRV